MLYLINKKMMLWIVGHRQGVNVCLDPQNLKPYKSCPLMGRANKRCMWC